jgi:hypothetical protein
MTGKRSKKGRTNSNICFTGDNQSIAYIIPFNSYTYFTLLHTILYYSNKLLIFYSNS